MFALKTISYHFCSKGGGGGSVDPFVEVNNKEENFCPNYVQEFDLWTGKSLFLQYSANNRQ